jgi:hypothetical protein
MWHTDGDWLLGYDFIAPRSEYSSPEKASRQNVEHMKTQFDGWDPTLREKVCGLIEGHLDAFVWQMYETKPSQWVSSSGKIAILGDAAPWFHTLDRTGRHDGP